MEVIFVNQTKIQCLLRVWSIHLNTLC